MFGPIADWIGADVINAAAGRVLSGELSEGGYKPKSCTFGGNISTFHLYILLTFYIFTPFFLP